MPDHFVNITEMVGCWGRPSSQSLPSHYAVAVDGVWRLKFVLIYRWGEPTLIYSIALVLSAAALFKNCQIIFHNVLGVRTPTISVRPVVDIPIIPRA
jgi:hypothetical protein